MTQGVSEEQTERLNQTADAALRAYGEGKAQGDAFLLDLYRQKVLNSKRVSANKSVFGDMKARMKNRTETIREIETAITLQCGARNQDASPLVERFDKASLFKISKDDYKLLIDERKQTNDIKQENGRAELQGHAFYDQTLKMARWVVQQAPTLSSGYLAMLLFLFAVSARINEIDRHAKRTDNHVVDLDTDFELHNDWTFVHKNGSKEKSHIPRPPRCKVLMLPPKLVRQLREYIKTQELKGLSAYYKQKHSQAKDSDGTTRFENEMKAHGFWQLVKPIESGFTPNTFRSVAITLFPHVHDITAVAGGEDQQRRLALTIQGNHCKNSQEYLQYANNRVLDPPLSQKRIKLTEDKDGLIVDGPVETKKRKNYHEIIRKKRRR